MGGRRYRYAIYYTFSAPPMQESNYYRSFKIVLQETVPPDPLFNRGTQW